MKEEIRMTRSRTDATLPATAAPDSLVWVVIKGEGLKQVAVEDAPAAIAEGRGRIATDRDLEVGGIDPSLR